MNHTRTKITKICALTALVCGALTFSTKAVDVALYEWAINVNGTVYDSFTSMPGDLPASVNTAAFDFSTGLGTITASVAAGTYFAMFVDHEIDEGINTYANEYGQKQNTALASQSWEIDEPGWVFGDIYANFSAGVLDNSNGVPSSTPDDVSMAIGWDVQTAGTITMNVGTEPPASGLYLVQTDPASAYSLYFSSEFRAQGIPDGGSSLAFLGVALGGLGALRRRIQA